MPSWTEHFLLVPIGMAVQAFIPTPGGIGGAELVFGELLSNGAMGAIFQRAILWVMALFGYLVYLGMKPALAQIDPPVSRDALAEPATES